MLGFHLGDPLPVSMVVRGSCSSSTFFRSSAPAQVLPLTSGSACFDLLPRCDCVLLLLRAPLPPVYAGVLISSVLMLSRVSLRPLLTELLSSQLSMSPGASLPSL